MAVGEKKRAHVDAYDGAEHVFLLGMVRSERENTAGGARGGDVPRGGIGTTGGARRHLLEFLLELLERQL